MGISREKLTAFTVDHPNVAGAVVMALAVLFFLPTWLLFANSEGAVLGWSHGDMAASYYYWREFGFRSLASGTIPFWNPHTFCGNPFAANYEAALFYPLNWIFLVLPVGAAINISVALHLWMAGWFTFLLARKFDLGLVASCFAGFTFIFSEPILGRIFVGHISILCAIAWFPLLLYFAEKLLTETELRDVPLAGVAYGMAVLAGHPQILFYSSFLLVVYTLARIAWRSPGDAARNHSFVKVAAMLGIGILIGSVQLLLTFLAQREGSRQAMTYESATSFSLPFDGFATLLSPAFFGTGTESPYWGPWYHWEIGMFLGVGPLLLLPLGIFLVFSKTGSRPLRILTILLGFCLIFALGGSTPLYRLIYVAPGFDFFRGPAKILGHGAMFAAILVGYSFDRVARDLPRVRKFLIASAATLGGVYIILLLATLVGGGEFVRGWSNRFVAAASNLEFRPEFFDYPAYVQPIVSDVRGALLLGVLAVIIYTAGCVLVLKKKPAALVPALLVAHGVLTWWTMGYFVMTFSSESRQPPAPLTKGATPSYRVQLLDPRVSPNAAMLGGFHTINGYEPIYPRRFGEFINAVNGRERDFYTPHPDPERQTPAFRVLSANRIWDGEEITEFPSALPRVRLYTSVRFLTDPDATFAAVGDPAWNPAEELILSAEPDELPPPSSERGIAGITKETPNSVTVYVETQDPCYLLLADNWHPGWTAEAAGRDLPVLVANHAFRAVRIDGPFKGEVHFRYRAPGFVPGLLMSLLGIGVVIGLFVYDLRRPRKRNSTAPRPNSPFSQLATKLFEEPDTPSEKT